MVENSLEGGFGATFNSGWNKGRQRPRQVWTPKKISKAVCNEWLYWITKANSQSPIGANCTPAPVLTVYFLWGGVGGLRGGHELIDWCTMVHFTKGQTLRKHSGVDDDRRGEEGKNKGAESIPLRPTWSPGVLLLLHFQETTLICAKLYKNSSTEPDLHTKNYYRLSKQSFSRGGCILIKTCKKTEFRSLTRYSI